MSESPSIWFRIGYALERSRQEPTARRLRGIGERLDGRRGAPKDAPSFGFRQREGRQTEAPRENALDALITAGAGALAGRVLGLVPVRRRSGLLSLLRGGGAGAGAALLRELVDPLLRGEPRIGALGARSTDAMISGAARGLLYGAILEPRLPGSPLLRGAIYGSIEYIVSPWGGLTAVLGDRAPHRRIPFLAALFEQDSLGDGSYLDHLTFGVALALLYGPESGTSRIGIDEDL